MHSLKHEVAIGVAKAAPAIAGASYSWLTLSEVAAISTILYASIMGFIALHKHYYFVKEKSNKKSNKKGD